MRVHYKEITLTWCRPEFLVVRDQNRETTKKYRECSRLKLLWWRLGWDQKNIFKKERKILQSAAHKLTKRKRRRRLWCTKTCQRGASALRLPGELDRRKPNDTLQQTATNCSVRWCKGKQHPVWICRLQIHRPIRTPCNKSGL